MPCDSTPSTATGVPCWLDGRKSESGTFSGSMHSPFQRVRARRTFPRASLIPPQEVRRILQAICRWNLPGCRGLERFRSVVLMYGREEPTRKSVFLAVSLLHSLRRPPRLRRLAQRSAFLVIGSNNFSRTRPRDGYGRGDVSAPRSSDFDFG